MSATTLPLRVLEDGMQLFLELLDYLKPVEVVVDVAQLLALRTANLSPHDERGSD